jgi:hypothetical protein
MAVRHGYGKIAGTDALVFAYDTGDTRNSYKGEPTTNIVTNPTFLGTPNTQTSAIADNWYFSGDTSATGFRFYDSATAPIPLKFPNEGAVITTGPNGTTNRRIYYNGTVEPNTTYTLSYWLYSSAFGSISNYFFTYKADGTGTTSPSYGQGFTTGQWVFIQQSFTTPADTGNTRNVNWGPVISAGTNSLFAMQRFQIEAKSHATQFVNGTRSATQGLLDLTGTGTLSIDNATYDSSAMMTFDGSNDYISTSNSYNGSDSLSVETICKFYSVSSPADQVIYFNANGQGLYPRLFKNSSNKFFMQYRPSGTTTSITSNTTPQANQFYHTVFTYNVTTGGILYINGVVDGTNSGVTGNHEKGTNHAIRIGNDTNVNYYMNGEIPVVKKYNRALTANEVRNNYRHYKTRFNI